MNTMNDRTVEFEFRETAIIAFLAVDSFIPLFVPVDDLSVQRDVYA